MNRNIILIGFKNSGKSTVGKLLASKLNWQFVDMDKLIEKRYKYAYQALTISEIYKMSSTLFRQLEKEAICYLLGNTSQAVIATGGGSILDETNRVILRKLGHLIYLKTGKTIIKDRMFSNRSPSFINTKHPKASFEEMYKQRENIYRSIADIILDANNKSTQKITMEILREMHYGQ